MTSQEGDVTAGRGGNDVTEGAITRRGGNDAED